MYAQEEFAQVLNLNKRFADTLEFITPLYRDNYEVGFGVHEIIKALNGLGKSVNDFNWIVRPIIFRLDTDTLKQCIEFLRGKRKPQNVSVLYSYLLMKSEYIDFKEEQLCEFLLKHPDTFEIKSEGKYYWMIEVKLIRK